MTQEIDKKFYKTLFTIGIPIAFQNLIISLLNMIDTFMISSLSTASIAGVGAANRIYFLLNLLLFGACSGSAILASQYFGAKDVKSIRKVLGLCLVLGVSAALIFSIGAIFFSEPIMRLFAPSEESVISEGSKYLRITGYSYLFFAITFSYAFISRTTHHVKLPVIISVVSIIINTFLNWTLIYGNLGMPELGVEGAAIATVIARIFECIVLVSLTYRYKLPAAAKIRELFDLTKSFVGKYFATVTPVILNEAMWALGVTGYALVFGRMGQTVLASMTMTQTVEHLAFVILIGIGNACAVMLGNELGANNKDTALLYAKKFMKLIFSMSLLIGIILIATSGLIANIFNVEMAVKENIRNTLIVFSIFFAFKGLNFIIIVGILRSGGDTVASMIIDTTAVWLMGIPMAILGGIVLRLDIEIVYAMIMLEEVAKLTFGMKRVLAKKWLKNLVDET